MEVTVLDETTRAQLRTMTTAVYDKWVPTIGNDIVQKAETAISASR